LVTLSQIAESDYILVFNKPPCIHSTLGVDTLSIAALLKAKGYPPIGSKNDYGLVNRLDYETSGILVVAKSIQVWQELHLAFVTGRCTKEYLAIVENCTVKDVSVVSSYLGNRYRGSRKVSFSLDSSRGKFTKSVVKVVRRTALGTVVKVRTKTGARHQVRVHLASLKAPLIGDFLYGSSKSLANISRPFFLHALCITLPPPYGSFSTPIPEELYSW
jgi:23S rRNA pseudouridine1911/1915/1917 synthase